MTNLAKSLGFVALLFCTFVQAQVSHVSINSRMFELGAYPKMRLNVIVDNQDMTRLEFVVHQSGGEEKLMAEQLNRFLVLLTGVEDVTDPKARLLVREYRIDRWYEVKNLPLFAMENKSKKTDSSFNSATVAANSAPDKVVAPVTGAQSVSMADKDHPNAQGEAKDVVASQVAMAGCMLSYSANETLWRIANRYALEWQVNVYGAMLAIFDANPKSFAQNNINALRKGAILYCPSAEMLAHYPNAKVAKAAFEAQANSGRNEDKPVSAKMLR